MDEVRCICGGKMGLRGHELATYVSGGRYSYARPTCGATTGLQSRHGVDDEIIGGALCSPDGQEMDLTFDFDEEEWRVAS